MSRRGLIEKAEDTNRALRKSVTGLGFGEQPWIHGPPEYLASRREYIHGPPDTRNPLIKLDQYVQEKQAALGDWFSNLVRTDPNAQGPGWFFGGGKQQAIAAESSIPPMLARPEEQIVEKHEQKITQPKKGQFAITSTDTDGNERKTLLSKDTKTKKDAELDFLNAAIKKYEKKKAGQVDLSALLALTDSWTGSKLMQAYDSPRAKEEDRERAVMGLKNKLAQRKADITVQKERTLAQLAQLGYRQKQDKLDRDLAERKFDLSLTKEERMERQRKKRTIDRMDKEVMRAYKGTRNAINSYIHGFGKDEKEELAVYDASLHKEIMNEALRWSNTEEGQASGLNIDEVYNRVALDWHADAKANAEGY